MKAPFNKGDTVWVCFADTIGPDYWLSGTIMSDPKPDPANNDVAWYSVKYRSKCTNKITRQHVGLKQLVCRKIELGGKDRPTHAIFTKAGTEQVTDSRVAELFKRVLRGEKDVGGVSMDFKDGKLILTYDEGNPDD